jgi:indolepyruvate ferredoxin oxidoreductase
MGHREIDKSLDLYGLDGEPRLLSGLQALVRLLLLQSRRDRLAGLHTAGFVSGYRGSPLGGLDQALWQATTELEAAHVRFQPGLNEELAATAIWGSQQVNLFPDAKYDGVFGLWYGKGPGVDRSGDAFKHGNSAGTSPHGGVLVVAGDDHACKSSTLAQQSELAFIDAMLPVLNPADVAELIELGLYGYALSRYSGCWVGFIVTQDTADATQTVVASPEAPRIVLPEMPPAADGLHIRLPDPPLAQEHRLHTRKMAAVRAFAHANPLDRLIIPAPHARFGIVTVGKAHGDAMQALDLLGIDARRAHALGLRLLKIGMSWPLEPARIASFAADLDEILVVEEKRGVVESQIKEQLYDRGAGRRPVVIGKRDERGGPLLPSAGELTAGLVARAIARRLAPFDRSGEIARQAEALEAREASGAAKLFDGGGRMPHFCSGCPHNTSTRVPEGSRAAAGIGCHFMALWMGRSTSTYTQMGAEGAGWIGQAPFVTTEHMFQNLGDGTYTHSGLLAIRAAVAAGVNITYKVLYNDAVAMTGGQPVEGGFTPAQIAQQLVAEGVHRVVIITDHPGKYSSHVGLPAAVNVFGRDAFDRTQRQLREHKGVTALIYDQSCAAELRRKRKRGLAPLPERRVVINEHVCEGCGDCNEQSNCLSVLPLETELGRKRAIDQSACNRDYSCLQGFCPSFVTLRGAKPRPRLLEPEPELTAPAPAARPGPCNVVIAGVGGTGVVTLGKILGLAAHLEGKTVVEVAQTGLAQKFGAVLSHVRIADEPGELRGGRVPEGGADVLLGCDLMVAAAQPALSRTSPSRSAVIVNAHDSLPPAFVHERDLRYPGQALLAQLHDCGKPGDFAALDATRWAVELLGDALLANVILLGVALQKGMLPVAAASLEHAFELFGASAAKNKRALALGRHAAGNRAAVEAMLTRCHPSPPPIEDLDQLVAHRRGYLTDYQDEAYARRYCDWVERIRAKEVQVAPGSTRLAEAIARQYFRLLAYKDEYEVARLYTRTGFLERLEADYEGPIKLSLHLAPPILQRIDPITGRPRKREFGAWVLPVLSVLARLRRLRGSWLDPFGYTRERRTERSLIVEYEALMGRLLAELDASRFDLAVALAELPGEIRGFGPVKAAAIARASGKREELLRAWAGRPGGGTALRAAAQAVS